MYLFGPILKITILLDISYIISSTGIGAMFVSQTIFLADIVDYGEYKSGKRNESITFSMKGFLQKMAYTIQTIVLFGGLGLVNYNEQIQSAGRTINAVTQNTIGFIAFGFPAVLILISLIILAGSSNSLASWHKRYMTISAKSAVRNTPRAIKRLDFANNLKFY